MIHLLLWLLSLGLYFPIFTQLYTLRWSLIDYSHAYFVLPICIFLAWLSRKEILKAIDVKTSSGAYAALMILGVFLLILGVRSDFLFISTLSLIPLLAGFIGYIYGPNVVKTLKLPLLYLFFLVPPPAGILDAITLPLRHWTSAAVVLFLRSFDFPIQKQGLLIYLDNHEIYMAPACSGFRSLITFLALAVLYLHFTTKEAHKSKVLLASIIPLALFGNFVRVVLLCLITYFLGEDMGQGFLHTLSGILVFLVMILGFMGIDRLLDRSKNAD